MIFEGLSFAKNCLKHKSAPLNILKIKLQKTKVHYLKQSLF